MTVKETCANIMVLTTPVAMRFAAETLQSLFAH